MKMSLTTNNAVAAAAIGAFLRRLGRKGQNPDCWEAEHLVRALACLECGQYRQVFHYVAMAVIPPSGREPAAVEQIEKIAAQHVLPSLATLRMILNEICDVLGRPNGGAGPAPRDIFRPIAVSAIRH
jgi:hypothetical protein